MTLQERFPIPVGSVVTEAMIDAWCGFYGIKHDETQRDGVLGTLLGLEQGDSVLPAKLVNGNDVFAALRAAYCKSKEIKEPEDWKKPFNFTPDEKLSEAADAAT